MLDCSQPDRLRLLDGLRGLAILLVVWYHLWLVTGYAVPHAGWAQLFARNGFLGVDLFFFLSGFCIALPYARARAEGGPSPSLTTFVRKRARKIVPSYVLALAIFTLVFRDRFADLGDLVAHLLAHAAFVHSLFPATFGSFSGPLWTLAVEVQFYALFAVLAPLVVRRPVAVYAAFVAIATAYRAGVAVAGAGDDFVAINQLPAVLDVFGAGVLGAFVYYGMPAALARAFAHPLRATLLACGAFAAAVAGLAASTAASNSGGDPEVHRWVDAWRGAFGPVLLIATLGIARGAAGLRACVAIRPLRLLSAVSYNAYLWNLEIAVGLARLGWPRPAVFWLGAGATLAISALVTYGFERPIQRLGLRGAAAALRRRLPVAQLRDVAEGAG